MEYIWPSIVTDVARLVLLASVQRQVELAIQLQLNGVCHAVMAVVRVEDETLRTPADTRSYATSRTNLPPVEVFRNFKHCVTPR